MDRFYHPYTAVAPGLWRDVVCSIHRSRGARGSPIEEAQSMSTIAASHTSSTSPVRSSFRRTSVWLTALALVIAATAVTVWLVVATSSDRAKSTTPQQVTNVQVDKNGQPGTRPCPRPQPLRVAFC
jgi:hypothetical protein